MAGMHRATALGLSVAVVSLVMAAGCLTLSTSQEGGGGGLSGDTCATVADCPSVMQCHTMSCIDGTCTPGFVPKSVPCAGNQVCDGAGSCVDCAVDNDCPGGSPTCENNHCISCSDGVKNGEETDIDCGGSRCYPCVIPCSDSNECASGNCVDGVCCNTPCTDQCKSCAVPGKAGLCANLPKGTEDPGVCDTTKACSGAGATCLLKNGQPCMDDSQCLSDECSITDNICEDD